MHRAQSHRGLELVIQQRNDQRAVAREPLGVNKRERDKEGREGGGSYNG